MKPEASTAWRVPPRGHVSDTNRLILTGAWPPAKNLRAPSAVSAHQI